MKLVLAPTHGTQQHNAKLDRLLYHFVRNLATCIGIMVQRVFMYSFESSSAVISIGFHGSSGGPGQDESEGELVARVLDEFHSDGFSSQMMKIIDTSCKPKVETHRITEKELASLRKEAESRALRLKHHGVAPFQAVWRGQRGRTATAQFRDEMASGMLAEAAAELASQCAQGDDSPKELFIASDREASEVEVEEEQEEEQQSCAILIQAVWRGSSDRGMVWQKREHDENLLVAQLQQHEILHWCLPGLVGFQAGVRGAMVRSEDKLSSLRAAEEAEVYAQLLAKAVHEDEAHQGDSSSVATAPQPAVDMHHTLYRGRWHGQTIGRVEGAANGSSERRVRERAEQEGSLRLLVVSGSWHPFSGSDTDANFQRPDLVALVSKSFHVCAISTITNIESTSTRNSQKEMQVQNMLLKNKVQAKLGKEFVCVACQLNLASGQQLLLFAHAGIMLPCTPNMQEAPPMPSTARRRPTKGKDSGTIAGDSSRPLVGKVSFEGGVGISLDVLGVRMLFLLLAFPSGTDHLAAQELVRLIEQRQVLQAVLHPGHTLDGPPHTGGKKGEKKGNIQPECQLSDGFDCALLLGDLGAYSPESAYGGGGGTTAFREADVQRKYAIRGGEGESAGRVLFKSASNVNGLELQEHDGGACLDSQGVEAIASRGARCEAFKVALPQRTAKMGRGASNNTKGVPQDSTSAVCTVS
jgi:hypothetical protein